MSQQISRRKFLQVGVGAAAGLAVSQLNVGAAKAGTENQPLATLLNIEKCVACGACVEACAESNDSKYPTPERPLPKNVSRQGQGGGLVRQAGCG
jgi:formate dehydrogenase iron-sulfur subunit